MLMAKCMLVELLISLCWTAAAAPQNLNRKAAASPQNQWNLKPVRHTLWHICYGHRQCSSHQVCRGHHIQEHFGSARPSLTSWHHQNHHKPPCVRQGARASSHQNCFDYSVFADAIIFWYCCLSMRSHYSCGQRPDLRSGYCTESRSVSSTLIIGAVQHLDLCIWQ